MGSEYEDSSATFCGAMFRALLSEVALLPRVLPLCEAMLLVSEESELLISVTWNSENH